MGSDSMLLGLLKYIEGCVLDSSKLVHFEESDTGVTIFLENLKNIVGPRIYMVLVYLVYVCELMLAFS